LKKGTRYIICKSHLTNHIEGSSIMPDKISPIPLPLPLRMGQVNCYLLQNDNGYFLFDTGGKNNRRELVEALENAGCQPGNLKLIILTHGDFDHIANAAYLRDKYRSKIAMHPDDAGMAEHGDMSWNREHGRLLLKLSGFFFGFGSGEKFTPDIPLLDGDRLTEFGLDAQVLSIPGHSSGSIGIYLNESRELIGGDLIDGSKEPALSSIMDKPEVARESVERLRGYDISTIYPGHGSPFAMADFLLNYMVENSVQT
jgi:glyoxylase-like metal-dependent hydrolase (beta-lactamase superfamily II)